MKLSKNSLTFRHLSVTRKMIKVSDLVKKLVPLIMLLSACGTYKFTYQLDSNDYPVKGDNVIKVNTSKSDQENFDDF